MTSRTLVIKKTSIEEKIKDVISILILFFATIFVVYFLPKSIGNLFILFVLMLFFKSDKDYLWLAYFFILMIDPGNFFFNNDLNAPFRLPIFTLSTGISLSTNDIFMFAALIKAIASKNNYRYILTKPILLILIYASFLLLISVTIYGSSFDNLIFYLRNFTYWSYFISVAFLLKGWDDVTKFLYLLFPFVFMVFFFGIYFYITGHYFVELFNPGPLRSIFLIGMEGTRRWNGIGSELLLLCFIGSLSLSILHKNENKYLILVGFSSYFVILLTATRIWFVVFTLILLTFLYKSKRVLRKLAAPFVFMLIIFIIVINFNPQVLFSFSKSTERITSVFEFTQPGSMVTQEIKYRMESHMPKVKKAIAENPFLGWGFSDMAKASLNNDVGNFSLIAQVGIFGFILFAYFWYRYLKIMFKIKNKFYKNSLYRSVFLIFIAAFLGFLIAHFTTHLFFSISLVSVSTFFLCFFIYFSECFIRLSLKESKRINYQKNKDLKQ